MFQVNRTTWERAQHNPLCNQEGRYKNRATRDPFSRAPAKQIQKHTNSEIICVTIFLVIPHVFKFGLLSSRAFCFLGPVAASASEQDLQVTPSPGVGRRGTKTSNSLSSELSCIKDTSLTKHCPNIRCLFSFLLFFFFNQF